MAENKIALLQGGLGAERDISRLTGQAFAKALDHLGHNYEVIDAGHDLPIKLAQGGYSVALLALHGKYAEDGTVQGICEYLGLPYTGSGVLASALCMDKYFFKQIMEQNQIPTPKFQIIDLKKSNKSDVQLELDVPVVVKPSREGSSVGVTILEEASEFSAALDEAAKYDYHILVEDFIPGMELTVPIVGTQALTPIEIVPKSSFYDFKNKYTAGRTEYHLPARLDPEQSAQLQQLALKAYETCRIKSYGRVDFRWDERDGTPYIMEINTLPGCTPTSLLPKAAAYDGIEFSQLIQMILDSAGLDYEGVS